ncbi:TetR/AcrR family transcriptional regulator [Streptomyces sp. NPDC008343]|uniref:TetR/AcrR family transcriptional regulator n=1 Tax=Streptomyces sp. NPDC008343 TaxID=3364828 RepID=UPI0036E50BC0
MNAQRRAPRAARRNEAARRAILTAALALTAQDGYARLTIERIAVKAGTGKQTIYRWWPSKGAVLLDALLMISEGDGDGTRPAELPDTGDLEADLKAVLHATVSELNTPEISKPMRALALEMLGDDVLAADYRQRLERPVKEMKRRRLRRAQLAGHLAPEVDLDVAIEMIWGPLRNRWLHREGPLTSSYVDTVLKTALDGMRPRP